MNWERDLKVVSLVHQVIQVRRVDGCFRFRYPIDCTTYLSLSALAVKQCVVMIADKQDTEDAREHNKRRIVVRKVPLGVWLLEKLGLCNCCPRTRCACMRRSIVSARVTHKRRFIKAFMRS